MARRAAPRGPILVVEDDPVTARLLERTLSGAGHEVRVAGSAEAAAELLQTTPASLVILDLVLPDADGRSLLQSLRSYPETAAIPVIAMSVSSGVEIRNVCLGLGAEAFIAKPFDVVAFATRVEEVLADATARASADRDPVTGMVTRAGMRDAFARLRAEPGKGAKMSVAAVDVDRFRAVNESCGMATGDSVLRVLAGLVAAALGPPNVLGRWEGDRFLALLPGAGEAEAVEAVERALEVTRRHRFASEQGGAFELSFSAGVLAVPTGTDFDEAVGEASGLLYLAKAAGRDRVVSASTQVVRPSEKVLLADDDRVTAAVVKNTLGAEGIEVVHATDGEAALEAAAGQPFGLFLLDVNMPVCDGFEVLERLRADPAYARVPIAMLTSMGDDETIVRAFAEGADDYLVKPVSAAELVARMRRLLTRWVEGRLHELQGSALYVRGLEVLREAFAQAAAGERLPIADLTALTLRLVEQVEEGSTKILGQVMNPTLLERDYLAQHSLNSAILATIVGQEMGLQGDDIEWLCLAGLLHEIGCVRLREGLLLSSTLKEPERAEIERRPQYSFEIINALGADFADAAQIALQVHERPDGSGYPKGLEGNAIRLEAQILGAVEVFEALTHHRPYRDRHQASSDAIQHLLASRNTHFLDNVLKALIGRIGLFPIGSYVELRSREVARVLEHRAENPMRPLLAVVADAAGAPLAEPRVVDLLLNPQIHISGSVPPPQIGRAG